MRLLAATCAAALVAVGSAEASEFGAVPGAAPLSPPQLEELRGGLQTPDGVEFNFGAVVRTFVDGALALETTVTWTDQGPIETFSSADLAQGAQPGISVPDSGHDWRGVTLAGDGGLTTVLHQLDDGAVRNVILNTANNRNIRQETDVTLSLPALDQLQQDALAAQLSLRLGDAMNAALGEAAGH